MKVKECISKFEKNQALSIIYDDIKNNKQFGSLFQFWKEQVLSELEKELPECDYDKLHKIAIKIVKRIAQDSSL